MFQQMRTIESEGRWDAGGPWRNIVGPKSQRGENETEIDLESGLEVECGKRRNFLHLPPAPPTAPVRYRRRALLPVLSLPLSSECVGYSCIRPIFF
jgi:hypothetical protein